jgi:hypothetical protein
MTVSLLIAAEEMGLRCPEDFGLVSFDDYPWLAVFHPKLTTVELPKYQLGQEAVELLLDRIAGKDGPGVLKKLQPELRVRESCGFKQQQASALQEIKVNKRLQATAFLHHPTRRHGLRSLGLFALSRLRAASKKRLQLFSLQTAIALALLRHQYPLDKSVVYELKALGKRSVFAGQRVGH